MIERKKYGICLFVPLKRKNIFLAQQISGGKDGKLIQMIKVFCCYSLLSTSRGEGEGHLAGILPQIWPHSAGLGAPLNYQKSCKPETTPGEAFSRALKIES